MTVKAIQFSSLDFVKDQDDAYYELLRLARVSKKPLNQIIENRKPLRYRLNQILGTINQ